MTKKKTVAVVLAAGLGTRMKSAVAKVMHPLAGRPMITHLLDTLAKMDVVPVVVVGPGMEDVEQAAAPYKTVIQEEPLGTGHAVRCALSALAALEEGAFGDVLVLFAGDPLITTTTLQRLLAARQVGEPGAAVAVLGFRPDDPGLYGRMLLDLAGNLEAIVEAGDATPEQLDVELCNSGVMAIDGALIGDLIERIGTDNAKGEYYLTDIIAIARADGRACVVAEGNADELMGVDCRADLARAEAIVQHRLRQAALEGGATLIDPDTVWFSFDTKLGRDVTVGPNVFFGPGVTVADTVEIRAFCHLEGAIIEAGAIIGPFARLRPGTRIGERARIGNFVEVKNAVLEPGAKANHLSYIGDARVGAAANIGAGTITCNYDGFTKGFTDIGKGAFIGSNTALVAPVRVGDGAIIGAGTVVAKDVAADALAVTRAKHLEVPGAAKRYRRRKQAEKDKAKKE